MPVRGYNGSVMILARRPSAGACRGRWGLCFAARTHRPAIFSSRSRIGAWPMPWA